MHDIKNIFFPFKCDIGHLKTITSVRVRLVLLLYLKSIVWILRLMGFNLKNIYYIINWFNIIVPLQFSHSTSKNTFMLPWTYQYGIFDSLSFASKVKILHLWHVRVILLSFLIFTFSWCINNKHLWIFMESDTTFLDNKSNFLFKLQNLQSYCLNTEFVTFFSD